MTGHFAQNAATYCVPEFAPLSAIGFLARSSPLGLDVCSPERQVVQESKSHPRDALIVQVDLCERFHSLISRQILFRRREVR